MGVPVCIDVLLLPACDLHGNTCRQTPAYDADSLDALDIQGPGHDPGPLPQDKKRKVSPGDGCCGGQDLSGWKSSRESSQPIGSKKRSPRGDVKGTAGVKDTTEDKWSATRSGDERGMLLERWTIEARKRG